MNRNEQTQATRKLIVESAMKIFGEKNYTATSMSDISKNANISKGIIYHYFKNKDDLYLACVKICFDGLSQHLATFKKDTNNIEETIGAYINFRHRFFEENTDITNVFFGVILGKYHGLSNEIIQLRTDLDEVNLKFLRGILETVKFRDGITAEDAVQVISLLTKSSQITTSNQVEPYEPHDFMVEQEKFIKITMKIIFHGIGKEDIC